MEDVAPKQDSTNVLLKLSLGDFLVFVKWMDEAHRAFERGDSPPAPPDLESDRVRGWVHLIQKLEERYRRGEEKQMSLEANLQSQEGQLGEFLSRFYENIAALYDNLGQEVKAQEIRKKVSTIHTLSSH